MKVVILCGGLGTRLRELTRDHPKSMSMIGDKPILWHIMRIYAYHDIKEFILTLGYKGWQIKEYFLNLRSIVSDVTICPGDESVEFHDEIIERDWRITLAETGEYTMTGARIWRARRYLEEEETFCVTYGDGLSDVNLTSLIAYHKKQGCTGTITGVHPSSRYGLVQMTGNRATGFREKVYLEEDWINGGFMVFDGARVWDYLSDDPNLSLENGPLPAMAADRQLSVYRHNGFWMGMDTAHEYDLLKELWRTNQSPWRVWE
jgi:glucose-1-phosphate cytidylyltransferase